MVDFNENKISISDPRMTRELKELASNADKAGNSDGFINTAFEIQEMAIGYRTLSETSQMAAKSIFSDNYQTKAQKKDNIGMQNDALNVVNSEAAKEFIKSGDWDATYATISKQLFAGTVENEQYYKKMERQVKTVVDVMKGLTFNDKASVKKLHDDAVKALDIKEGDPFKDFKLRLVESFTNFAEARQRDIEKNNVSNRYAELRTAVPVEEARQMVQQRFKDKLDKFKAESSTEEQALQKFYDDPEVHAEFTKLNISKSREDAMKEIQNDKAFKGSYYKSVINEVENSEVLSDAANEVWTAIKNQYGQEDLLSCKKDAQGNPIRGTGKKITDYKTVRSAAKAEMSYEGKLDKYAEKVFGGQLSVKEKFAWEESAVKSFEKMIAAWTRSEEAKKKPFAKSEFTDELKNDAVFNALLRGGLIKENETTENGTKTYNITALSDKIKSYIGADLNANRQNKDFDVMAEVTRVKNCLFGAMDPPIIMSDKDTKNLIKLCGFDVESRNWARVFWDTFADTLIGAVGTVGAVAANVASMAANITTTNSLADPAKTYATHFDLEKDYPFTTNAVSDNTFDIKLKTGFTLKTSSKLNMLEDLINEQGWASDAVDIKRLDDGKGFRLILHTVDVKPVKVITHVNEHLEGAVTLEELGFDPNKDIKSESKADLNSNVMQAILTGLLINFGMSLLKNALNDKSVEKPVISTQFDDNIDVNTYVNTEIEANKSLTPDLKDALKNLAMGFVVDGEFKAGAFKAMLNRWGGDGGVLNLKEAKIGSFLDDKNPIEKPKPEPKPESKPVEQQTITQQTTEPVKAVEKFAAIKDEDNIDGTHTSWSKISEIYGDALPKDPKLRTRMLKVMQGMNGDKLTLEQLQTLAELSMKNIRNVKHLPAPNSQYMDPKDYAKKAQEAFKDVEFLKNYNFNYEVFASNVCLGSLGDEDNKLILPEVLYKNDEDKVGIKRLKTPDRETRKELTNKGSGKGSSVKKHGRASTVGEGKVDNGDGTGTHRTTKADAQSKIEAKTHKEKKYGDM